MLLCFDLLKVQISARELTRLLFWVPEKQLQCKCHHLLPFSEASKAEHLAELQGINATVFAYGATGSGKTFTMQQLLSLAAGDIFTSISDMPQREYTVQASTLEIYNERVRDLCREGTESQDLDLLDVRNKQTVLIKDLSVHNICSQAQLERLVALASARRTVPLNFNACKWQHLPDRTADPL